MVVINGPYGYFDTVSAVGCVSGEIQSPIAGYYRLTPCISGYMQDYHCFDPDNCFDVYIDSERVFGQCWTGEAGSYNGWDVLKDLIAPIMTPYSSKFDISFTSGQPPLFHGGELLIAIAKVYDSTHTCWLSSTDPLSLTIIGGSQYASLHRIDPQTGLDVSLGTTVTTVGDSVGSYWIDADRTAAVDSTGDSIIVEAQSAGLKSDASTLLEPPYLDHFDAGHPPIQHYDEGSIGLEPMNIYDHNIAIPDSTHIDITLDSAGIKYGNLMVNGTEGKAFKGVEWDSVWSLAYIADGAAPQQPADIQVTVTVPGQNVKPSNILLQVIPEPVVVTFAPSVISPGDTASITIKQRNDEGTLSDFSAYQQFEIGISSGENYGTILFSDGSTGGYASNVYQPFKFIAADSIDVDSTTVGIRVGTQEPELGSTIPGGKMKDGQSLSFTPQKSLTGGTTVKLPVHSRVKSQAMNPGAQTPGIKSSTKSIASTVNKGNKKSISDENSFQWGTFGIGYMVIKKWNGPNLNLARFAQDDPRWANIIYDKDVKRDKDKKIVTDKDGNPEYYTIQNKGCLLCGAAWVLTAHGYQIDPEQLNQCMSERSYEDGGYDRSLFNWYAIEINSGYELVHKKYPNDYFGDEAHANKPSILDSYLAEGDFVFAKVQDSKGGEHWVVVEGKDYSIMDAGFSGTSS